MALRIAPSAASTGHLRACYAGIMDSEVWRPAYVRWVRIYALSLLLSPAVWAVLVRPPDGMRAVGSALILTVFLGWPWIIAGLLLGTMVVRRFSRRTADLIAVVAALAVAVGTSQIGMMAR